MTEVKDGVKQLNVRIPSEIVEELKQYSETTGVPLGRIVTDALVAYRPTLKERAQALTLKAKAGKS